MNAMSTPAIEIEALTMDYPVGFWRKRMRRSLDNLSFQVDDGEVFGFLGPNGAGKTTTMKLLMGLIFPTAGTARVRGARLKTCVCTARSATCRSSPIFTTTLRLVSSSNISRDFLDIARWSGASV